MPGCSPATRTWRPSSRDYRRFSNVPTNRSLPPRQRSALPSRADWTMLFLDPPQHTRLRALVNKAFTPRAVAALEPHIRTIMGQLLDDIDDPSAFDLIAAVANPLPVIVIAEMLGVPTEDRERFKHWSDERARLLEPVITPEERKRALDAGESFDAYFKPVIEARRRAPQDDIVSALAPGGRGGRPAHRTRGAEHAAPAAGCRQRDHDEPDRQRPALVAAQSGTASALAGRPEPDTGGGGRAAALRLAGAARFQGRAGGLRGERRLPAPRRRRGTGDRRRPIATRRSSTSRSGSTSSAPVGAISRSVGACITVSAHPWPAWKGASRWKCCWSAIPRCACSRTTRYFAERSCCAASSRCRWRRCLPREQTTLPHRYDDVRLAASRRRGPVLPASAGRTGTGRCRRRAVLAGRNGRRRPGAPGAVGSLGSSFFGVRATRTRTGCSQSPAAARS